MSLNNYFGHYGSQADHPLAFFYDCQHSAESEYKSGSSIENTEALGTLIFDTSANATKEKKRRLTTGQIEFLERSFQEEIKLEPERKVRLSQELGIQPRQVAVWFQNRRARWKAKQLERVYNALKQEFDAISKEKQILQEEVTKLKAELEEKVRKESSGQTDVSGEETVESSVVRGTDSEKMRGSRRYNHIGGECHELFESNPTSPPYWCG